MELPKDVVAIIIKYALAQESKCKGMLALRLVCRYWADVAGAAWPITLRAQLRMHTVSMFSDSIDVVCAEPYFKYIHPGALADDGYIDSVDDMVLIILPNATNPSLWIRLGTPLTKWATCTINGVEHWVFTFIQGHMSCKYDPVRTCIRVIETVFPELRGRFLADR
jgi:hypothetical protein